MQVRPIKTRVFKERENLAAFIREHIPNLKDGSVLVITSKIIGLAEGRTVADTGEKSKERTIKAESDSAVKTKYVWLTMKDGMLMANAGLDASNAGGKFILLPADSFVCARKARAILKKLYRVKKLGILITDSHTAPLRAGVTGVALGYAGFKGIRDYRNMPDLFGRKFKFSQANVADGLAASAVLVMGEGKERTPLAVIEDAPVAFTETVNRKELFIPLKDDMYLPFLSKLPKRKK